MGIFVGHRTNSGCDVEYDGKNLNDLIPESVAHEDYLNFYNYSPDWGYEGDGPVSLSYAMLYVVTHDADFAKKHYGDFYAQIIARIEADAWEMSSQQVAHWVEDNQDKVYMQIKKFIDEYEDGILKDGAKKSVIDGIVKAIKELNSPYTPTDITKVITVVRQQINEFISYTVDMQIVYMVAKAYFQNKTQERHEQEVSIGFGG